MKDKGVLISMAVILVIGILITKSTHNFIENNSSGGDMAAAQAITEAIETIAQESTAGAAQETMSHVTADMEPAMAGAAAHDMEEEGGDEEQGAALMAASFEEDAGDALKDRMSETLPADLKTEERGRGIQKTAGEEEEAKEEAAMASITPLDPPAAVAREGMADWEINMEKDSSVTESQSYYKKRFQDLDNQIQKNRDSQTDSNVNNSARSTASNELKLWDSELNSIYGAILDRLNPERSEELVEEQRAWLKERDSIAMEAVKNSPGGSSESLEYTVSLTESTRARAYELAEIYKAELAE